MGAAQRNYLHPVVTGPSTTDVARLNLGCGPTPHPAFVNVDLVAAPGVIGHDLRNGIPFPDGTYDLVYHSTMLSHLRPDAALDLTRECRRVLKPGGVLRVVTEDLEQMCRVYLEKLEAACAGDSGAVDDYEWMILELYDQATRESPGGRMMQYLTQDPIPNEAFIYSRIGETGRRMVSALRARNVTLLRRKGTRSLLSTLRAQTRKIILRAMMGDRGLRALEVGTFRLSSGQVTYQMYDRHSLGQLFAKAGLCAISVKTPKESAYRSWDQFNLDLDATGQPVRPHTLIMEGTRPS